MVAMILYYHLSCDINFFAAISWPPPGTFILAYFWRAAPFFHGLD